MSRIVERLADLTGFRDRDLLDIGLVRALEDLLHPRSIAIVCPVGEPGSKRWQIRARIGVGADTGVVDPPNVDLEALAPLDSNPARRDCLALGAMIELGSRLGSSRPR